MGEFELELTQADRGLIADGHKHSGNTVSQNVVDLQKKCGISVAPFVSLICSLLDETDGARTKVLGIVASAVFSATAAWRRLRSN